MEPLTHKLRNIVFSHSEYMEVMGLPADVCGEYFMERRYHGVGHEEALTRAWASPWVTSKKGNK